MFSFSVNPQHFNFKYLPAYAQFLLSAKLEDFVTVGIRFARQYDLPMMKPLARLSEKELTKRSLDSNNDMLNALCSGKAATHIEKNAKAWLDNKLEILDQHEVQAEDLTLAFYVRRKTFGHFLYQYSPNPAIHQLITEEVDAFTTQQELVNLKVYLHLHRGELH